jgi:catechol 2,3-dioxygenase-like lactoylglutathione lyase family enzyme
MTTPELGSMLIGTADPARLLEWYRTTLRTEVDDHGVIRLGRFALYIDGRDDVAARNREPGRMALEVYVDDPREVSRLGSLFDPDGNRLRIVPTP